MGRMTGLRNRDEIAVCIRDMVFVACGTACLLCGHPWFAAAAFVCAAIRFDLSSTVVYAKHIRACNRYVRAMRSVTDSIVKTAVEKGVMDEDALKAYREALND